MASLPTQVPAAAPAAAPLWTSRFAFVMAAVGSAVGLGNIWKFPYMAGTSGGGAFVLVYLVCILTVGVPVLIAEVAIGRRGGASPIAALGTLARRFGASRHWAKAGALGGGVALVILSFYSVVAGWALAYVPLIAGGGMAGAGAAASAARFQALLADPAAMLGWHSLFMAVTVAIVARGVTSGIERAVVWLMPGLFLLLAVLVGYAAVAGDFVRGVTFLFAPDWSKLGPEAVLAAAGHAFFTLSVGVGAMIAYGGYLPDGVSIPRTALLIAGIDTACALMAGLAIFPLVFALGLDPASGPGLLFVTLPVAFGAMPGGQAFGTAFFVLIGVAALTSAVALLEPLVAAMAARGRRRPLWAAIFGLGCWALGLVSLASFNLWAHVTPGGKTLFDWLNLITSDLLLPAGAIAGALFAGWVLPARVTGPEFAGTRLFGAWRLLVRYIAPAAILAVLLRQLAG